MRNVSDKAVEKIKTHCMFNKCIPKIVSFVRQCGKYCRAEQTTHDNIIRHRIDTICVADNYGKNTDTHS